MILFVQDSFEHSGKPPSQAHAYQQSFSSSRVRSSFAELRMNTLTYAPHVGAGHPRALPSHLRRRCHEDVATCAFWLRDEDTTPHVGPDHPGTLPSDVPNAFGTPYDTCTSLQRARNDVLYRAILASSSTIYGENQNKRSI